MSYRVCHTKKTLYPISLEVPAPIVAICTDPCGEYNATADTESTLSVCFVKNSDGLDPVSYETIHAKKAIQNMVFAPPDVHPFKLAIAGSDNAVSIITISPPTYPKAFSYCIEHEAPATAVAFSDEGMLAVRCLKYVYIYEFYEETEDPLCENAGKWRVQARVTVNVDRGLSFRPTGKYLVAGSCILKRLQYFPQRWELITRLDGPYDNVEGSENKDYSKVCCVDWGSFGFIAIGRENSVVEIWFLKGGKPLRLSELRTDNVVCQLQWDRVGFKLAGIDAQGTTYLIFRKYEDDGMIWVCQKC